MTNALKPCPFCGKGAIKGTAKKNGKTLKFAGCLNELCSAERWKLPIQQWNKRAVESELAEAIKEAIAEIEYWHADMLEPEERNHPRGNGWARVYDKLNAVIAERAA